VSLYATQRSKHSDLTLLIPGFYINLPLGAVALAVLALVRIPDRTAKIEGSILKTVVPKLDLPGFIIFSPAAIMFLLALQFGPEPQYGWSSATVIGLFSGSGVKLILFFLWEWRQGPTAMIPLAMVARREMWVSMLLVLLIMGGLVITNAFWLPIFFQSVLGKSPFMSGVYTLPSILSNTFLAVASGFLGMRATIQGQSAIIELTCGW